VNAKDDKLLRPAGSGQLKIVEKQHAGAGDVNRGISTHDGADQHGKSKILYYRPAKNVQSQHREKDGQRSQNGSAQGFVDGQIDDVS